MAGGGGGKGGAANPFFSNPFSSGPGGYDAEAQLQNQQGQVQNMFASSEGSGSSGAGGQAGTALRGAGNQYAAAQTTFNNDLQWANLINQWLSGGGQSGGGGGGQGSGGFTSGFMS